MKQFYNLEKRLSHNLELKPKYIEFMRTYKAMTHTDLNDNRSKSKRCSEGWPCITKQSIFNRNQIPETQRSDGSRHRENVSPRIRTTANTKKSCGVKPERNFEMLPIPASFLPIRALHYITLQQAASDYKGLYSLAAHIIQNNGQFTERSTIGRRCCKTQMRNYEDLSATCFLLQKSRPNKNSFLNNTEPEIHDAYFISDSDTNNIKTLGLTWEFHH